MTVFGRFALLALGGIALVALLPRGAAAHCDTLDGPVISDARAALASGDVTPVLKWVLPDKEAEVRDAFRAARAVRDLGPEARALADRFFFETLVRVHREGEGAPYAGLKPAGTPAEPGIAAADRALDTGAAEALVKLVTAEAERGLRTRFDRAAAAKKRAAESVDRGREYVAAYVDFVHFSERLLAAAASEVGHATHASEATTAGPHAH